MEEVAEKLLECDTIIRSLRPSNLKAKLLMTQETLRRNSTLMGGTATA